jgi:hypothetical protein
MISVRTATASSSYRRQLTLVFFLASQTCAFPGDAGWNGRDGANVLGAVRNVTGILEDYVTRGTVAGPDGLAEEALKFLVHFVGDMHMPLHLTGRERGGNGIKVRFDGRITSESFHDW